MESNHTDVPEEIDKIVKWHHFGRTHFTLPSAAMVIFGFSIGLLVIACFPAGSIASCLQTIPPVFHLMGWAHWWRIMILVVVLAGILLALFFKRKSDKRVAILKQQLEKFGGSFVVRSVEITRTASEGVSIVCHFYFFKTNEHPCPPEHLYLGTRSHLEQHMLVYNPKDQLYEGGANVHAFDDAIKQAMQIRELERGPFFFPVSLSTRGFTKGLKLISELKGGEQEIIACFDNELFLG
jgi:hypothetical protein